MVRAVIVKRNSIHPMVLLWSANQFTALSPITVGARYAGHETELQAILDLNRQVVSHMPAMTRSLPAPLSMDAPCATDGKIRPRLEFLMFGTWLMLDGHPGLRASPGPAVDEHMVLRTVAAASAILHWRANLYTLLKERHEKESNESVAPKLPSIKITAAQMRDHWAGMYHEALDQAVFKSRLKSAARHLAGYLDHLATQPLVLDAKTGKMKPPKSPHLKKVLLAMSARTAAG